VTLTACELVEVTSSAAWAVAVRVEGAGAEAAVRRAYERAFEQLPGYRGGDPSAWLCGFVGHVDVRLEPMAMPAEVLDVLKNRAAAVDRRAALGRLWRPPRRQRRRAMAVAVALIAVAGGLTTYAVRTPRAATWKVKPPRPPGVEPVELEPGVLIPDSFGYELGARWQQLPSGTKKLTFELPEPAVAVLYLDTTAAEVRLNGVPLALNDQVLAQELLLPEAELHLGTNVIELRAAEPRAAWRVENLWLYTFQISAGERGSPIDIAHRRLNESLQLHGVEALRAYQDVRLLAGYGGGINFWNGEWRYEEEVNRKCEDALETHEAHALYDRPDLGCFRKVRELAKKQERQP